MLRRAVLSQRRAEKMPKVACTPLAQRVSGVRASGNTGSQPDSALFKNPPALFLAPAVTVGERRELWILPPFFFGLFFCL